MRVCWALRSAAGQAFYGCYTHVTLNKHLRFSLFRYWIVGDSNKSFWERSEPISTSSQNRPSQKLFWGSKTFGAHKSLLFQNWNKNWVGLVARVAPVPARHVLGRIPRTENRTGTLGPFRSAVPNGNAFLKRKPFSLFRSKSAIWERGMVTAVPVHSFRSGVLLVTRVNKWTVILYKCY